MNQQLKNSIREVLKEYDRRLLPNILFFENPDTIQKILSMT